MALKFIKGKPTVHGLYAFSSDGKNTSYHCEINSRSEHWNNLEFYCYLGPIPVIEPADNLKRIFVDKILNKMIDKEPIIIKNKKTGEKVATLVPFMIGKVKDEVFINFVYGCSSFDFWEKDE